MELEYFVKDTNNYKDINQVLKNEFNISARLLSKLIKNKKILLNDSFVDTRTKIKTNDVIKILFDYDEDNSNIIPKKMNLDIIYEDNFLLAINKPAGITVHPSILHYENSLSNGIRFYFDQINLKKKIRPINRLDKDTSGIVIFAKNEYIQEQLIHQMQIGTFKKQYIALIDGILEQNSGIIDKPIARKENSIIERCISKDGKRSITKFEVLKKYNNYSLIKCYLLTGRTHQIRIHLKSINHPILGDYLYGNSSELISRQALHCLKISFKHPIYNTNIKLISKIPIDIKSLFI